MLKYVVVLAVLLAHVVPVEVSPALFVTIALSQFLGPVPLLLLLHLCLTQIPCPSAGALALILFHQALLGVLPQERSLSGIGSRMML
jgi:hypothetical protein